MELKRGMRDKLDKYVNLNDAIEITMSVDGPSVYDFCCFGVDSANKLSDDRYMIFYNQISSPYDEIIYSSSDSFASFTIKLPSLPINIQKLVFTVSIDGNSTMGNIDSYLLNLNQSGREALSLSLSGNDFGQEKAIVSIEIYKKDVWRINAVAMGFNGGLGDLLRAYGGEDMTSALQSPPSIPPKSAEDLYYQTDNCGDKKVSDNPEVIIEYNAENLSTKITVNGQPFDTSRIDGKEIEDWVYPFMIRKVKWNGIFEELSSVVGSESYCVQFIGNEKWLEVLNEECPKTITIVCQSDTGKEEISEKDILLSKLCAVLTNIRYSLQRDPEYLYNQAKNGSDKNQAFELYKKSADMGNIVVQLETGKCYYDKKNYNEAFGYFEKAADKGNPEAQYYKSNSDMQQLIEEAPENVSFNDSAPETSSTEFDNESAIDLYQQACYELDCAGNYEKAFNLFKKSANLGYMPAQEELQKLNNPKSMDTNYDLEDYYDYYYLPNNNAYFNPYGNDEDKNFIYSLFFFLDSDSGNEMIAILSDVNNYAKTGETKYNSIIDCFNSLIECYYLDDSEETEYKRFKNAKTITDMLFDGGKNSLLKSTLRRIRATVNYMAKDNSKEYDEAVRVLLPLNERMSTLINEINGDIKANKNKVFSYFQEVSESIVKVLHYKLYYEEDKNAADWAEYEKASKSADIKGMVAAVGGGFFGSFIGAKMAGKYSDKLYDELEKKRLDIIMKYAKNTKDIIYFSAVVLALQEISDFAIQCLIIDAECDADLEFNTDGDNFFDEI